MTAAVTAALAALYLAAGGTVAAHLWQQHVRRPLAPPREMRRLLLVFAACWPWVLVVGGMAQFPAGRRALGLLLRVDPAAIEPQEGER